MLKSYIAALSLGLASVAIASSSTAMKSQSSTHSYRSTADEAEIAKIEDIYMNSKSGRQMVPYLDPAHTFIWDVAGGPPQAYGVEGVRKHIDDILATNHFTNFKVHLVRMEVEADNNIGFANSIQHLSLIDASGKVLMDSDYRVSDTYHKVNGKWMVVGEHLSFPADLSTGKVIFGPIPFPDPKTYAK